MTDTGALVFGPVPSRRLGRSLGIDLVPLKTCSYDCVYCQLGRTTVKTTERRIGRIKDMTDIPVAVLTNGSLFWQKAVRDDLQQADVVIPSLDAGNEQMFRYVNRPAPELSFDQMVEGLVTFRQEYCGQYWLEVFLLGGVTGFLAEAEAIGRVVQRIGPDKVQLNTVTRPPAEDFAYCVPADELARLAPRIAANAEVIADYLHVHEQPAFAARGEDVLELLRRRPCTVEDIASGLGMHRNEVVKYVEQFLAEERIDSRRRDYRTYYMVRE